MLAERDLADHADDVGGLVDDGFHALEFPCRYSDDGRWIGRDDGTLNRVKSPSFLNHLTRVVGPKNDEVVRADVIKLDAQRDLALLRPASIPSRRPLNISVEDSIDVGTDVAAIGTPERQNVDLH